MAMDASDGPAIEMRDVTREYDTGAATVVALAGVDLTVGNGEFVVVLGPSGSGKTTLLNLIGALDTPSRGHVEVAGHAVESAGEHLPVLRADAGGRGRVLPVVGLQHVVPAAIDGLPLVHPRSPGQPTSIARRTGAPRRRAAVSAG